MLSRLQREPGAPGRDHHQLVIPGATTGGRRLLRGEYVAAARRDSQLQRYQVRVRGHLGETPGPAAPSPDGAPLPVVSRSGVADAVGGESPQPLDACSPSRARGWRQATEGSM